MRKDRKDNIMIATAVLCLVSGIIMSFLSFGLSDVHKIDSSVLWYFAQTLMYAASAFGLYSYVHAKFHDIKLTIDGNQPK